MTRSLVTGGAGFIGSHLVEALLQRGDEVRILDNFSTGRQSNLQHLAGAIQIHEGDIRNAEDMQSALKGMDHVFHLAAMVSVPESIEHPDRCLEINVNAVFQLMELARQEGIKSLVLASSTAVYGANELMPLKEEFAAQTLSPYAASKLFNENLARIYAENYGMHAVALRFFNVYGPRQLPDSDYAAVIPRFIHSLKNSQAPTVFGDGEQTRDFIYVEDVVRACLVAEKKREVSGGVFNVCSGVESSLNDLLEVFKGEFPEAPEAAYSDPRLGDVPRSVGDPSLAKNGLGFGAQIDLSAGLKKTIEVLF